MIDLSLQLRERAVEIFFRVLCAFTMNDPPFKLQTRRSIHIKRRIAHLAHGRVEIHQIRQRFFVVRSLLAAFENKSCFGSVIRDAV